jgi:hypothetical protein
MGMIEFAEEVERYKRCKKSLKLLGADIPPDKFAVAFFEADSIEFHWGASYVDATANECRMMAAALRTMAKDLTRAANKRCAK